MEMRMRDGRDIVDRHDEWPTCRGRKQSQGMDNVDIPDEVFCAWASHASPGKVRQTPRDAQSSDWRRASGPMTERKRIHTDIWSPKQLLPDHVGISSNSCPRDERCTHI
jgi:hypothetical protein